MTSDKVPVLIITESVLPRKTLERMGAMEALKKLNATPPPKTPRRMIKDLWDKVTWIGTQCFRRSR